MPRTVLLVEDDEMHAELVWRAFEDIPAVELSIARRLSDARLKLAQGKYPDIVVADLRLPDGEGIELAGHTGNYPVVIMTSQGSEAAAVDAMRAGALDYVVKSDGMFMEMPHIVQRALREWQHIQARERATRSLRAQYEIASALATSKTIQQAGPLILETVCRSVGWPAGEYWRLDTSEASLVREARWADETVTALFDTTSPTSTLSRGEGIPGMVWERQEIVRFANGPTNEKFRAAFGFPVQTSEGLIGALAFYTHDPEPPDEELQLLVGAISNQLAVFIRQQQAEEEHQRLQRELAERERLAAVGQTAAMLAHEIGNPLNSMYLSCQLMQRRLAKSADVDPRLMSSMEQILAENRRLNGLLDDFRSLSRRRELQRRPVEMADLLDRIVALQQPLLTAHAIELIREQPEHLPPVQADEAKLMQVLINLIKNAVEAMEAEGRLTLRIEMSGTDLLLEVEDTGPGIPEGIDVFEPFRSTKAAGTGLGLAIAREIIQGHGGSIDYRSSEGAGTTFRLVLPTEVPVPVVQ